MTDSSVALFDIDASTILESTMPVQSNQNAFLLCTAGSVTLAVDGKEYTLHPGDLYIYAAFSRTSVRSFHPNLQAVGGAADFEIVLKALESAGETQHLSKIRAQPHISLSAEQYGRITRMVGLISSRRSEASMFTDRIVDALIQVLLFEIMDAYVACTASETTVLSRADTLFTRFLTLLSKYFRNEREVGFYAGELGLTPRYFAAIIRDKSGMSPVGWIARFVVSEAKTLLANPDMSIKEVAMQLNFPNQSFFGRYFKQHTGMAPGEYRRHVLASSD